MSNVDKYKNTIDKIEIDENIVKSVIEKSKEYKRRSDVNMEKKRKIGSFGRVIITAATLLSVSAASYASYRVITEKITAKKNNVVLEGDSYEIETIEFDGVENNGIMYKIQTPDGVVRERIGDSDIYKDEDPNPDMPEVYLQVDIIDADQIESETEKIY